MLKVVKQIFIVLCLLGILSSAFAQQKSTSTKSSGSKRQTLDFEDELIQGDVAQPEIMSILQREDFNFKRLIRLRKDFLPEMRKSAFEVQKSTGGNKK